MVYVLDKSGQPLMPTNRHGKVKHLLNNGKAVVVKRCPFTIQLTYDSTTHTQDVTLGVDAGSKTIGLSATTETKELYASEVMLRNDISDLLKARRALRQSRRNRTTRYRKPRFDNRVHSKNKGWMAPSVEQKVESHLNTIAKVCKLLPINKIVIETASFDTQLLKAQDYGAKIPEGTDYQQGDTYGYANVREYVFHRDNHTCQWCKGKSGSKILHTHHWNYWRGDHTNKASSQITLCEVCNDSKNHKQDGFLWGWKPQITKSYKDAAFMGIMRWACYNRLKDTYLPLGIDVKMTFGYLTKETRIRSGLPKEHCVDARCISGHPLAEPIDCVYYQKKVRCHNRQLHKCTIGKGGIRKSNQAPKYVKGFQLFDKVLFDNQECFIFGRRSTGYFDLRLLDGTRIHKSASVKKLRLLETRKSYLIERSSMCCA